MITLCAGPLLSLLIVARFATLSEALAVSKPESEGEVGFVKDMSNAWRVLLGRPLLSERVSLGRPVLSSLALRVQGPQERVSELRRTHVIFHRVGSLQRVAMGVAGPTQWTKAVAP